MRSIKRQIIRLNFWQKILALSIFFLISIISSATLCGKTDIPMKSSIASTRIDRNSSQVQIRAADGITTINGKPFFPFGLIHVSWETTAQMRIKHLREIAAAGFNTIHASFKRFERLDEYEKFLDEAARLGIRVVTEFGNAPTVDPLVVIDAFKDKPAVLGWSIQDDANVNGKPGCEMILPLHQKVKAINPNTVTYIDAPPDGQYEKLNNCSDILAAQAYPIPFDPVSAAYDIVHSASNAGAKFSRAVYAQLQAFSWPNKRPPTFDEVRNMTYSALLAGAKGIIYYTYHDESWELSEHENLWKGLQSLAQEINQLSSILLEGNLTKINTDLENILAGIWTNQDKAVAIAINLYDNSITDFELELPTDFRQAIPMFEDIPSTAIIKKKKLFSKLGPLEVGIYNLKI